jgi:hypothetical protein
MISAFLSYSHEDRVLAGSIKGTLDYYGFDVFLAHEDLEPSVEWQDFILLQLRECVVFLLLLTDSFKRSDWTDQETGVAVALEKIIVPMKLTINPYGFVSKYQAQSFYGAANGEAVFPPVIGEACWSIVKTLGGHKQIGGTIKDGVISAFGRSGSFKEAARNAEKLSSIEPFSDQQLNEIVRVACANDQIWHGFEARFYVNGLIQRGTTRIDKLLARQFEKLQE